MTLEEIKTRIKSYHDIAESERAMAKNERAFYCLNSEVCAYRTCIGLLDHIEPSWHSYPAEIPDKDGTYLVTSENGSVYVFPFWVSNGKFSKDRRSSKVVAWMEMPKPYRKEAE